jgi:hypothetical protein
VADLLECLIQIKGVADTPRRLAERVDGAVDAPGSRDDVERRAQQVARRLLAAEARFREGLASMLSRDRPAVPAFVAVDDTDGAAGALGECVARFSDERADTVRILEACSAEQLNRIGIEPTRGPMTVADLVAVMLAHDTDRLGELVISHSG